MAFGNLPYTTLDEIHVNIDPNMTTTDDVYLGGLITQAQAIIDEYVGYSFQLDGTVLSPATRWYSGNGGDVLVIDPAQSVSQVQFVQRTVNVTAGGVYLSTTLTNFDITADCLLGPSRVVNNYKPGYALKRYSGETFDEDINNFKVSGVFGYASVPPLVTRACSRIVAHWFKMRDTNYADLVTETGAVREHYTKMLPPDVIEILELFKHRSFFGSRTGAW